ncbi:MAG: hypothetical protein JW814_03455 [Candidatus Krumholzibacteriota bacterium]|nr:hypothetical protein [Candidatus Krumholzibacteriota bacterium]
MSAFSDKGDSSGLSRFFGFRAILVIGAVFVLAVIVLNRGARYIFNDVAWFDCPLYWPASISRVMIPGPMRVLGGLSALLIFILAVIILRRTRYRLSLVILSGLILVLATNMMQGWRDGFVTPVSGGEPGYYQYYGDAVKISHPADFLRTFNSRQADLYIHSRSHPPGAVLSIYFLERLLGSPAWISIAIACVAVSLTSFFIYGIVILHREDRASAGYITFLFLLIPAVQIYFAASIDALVAAFLTGSLYFYIKPRSVVNSVASVVFLLLASFMTFGAVFVIPLFVLNDIITGRNGAGLAFVAAGVGLFHFILHMFSGFNYLTSFITASKLENPGGFYLLADPLSYLMTRLESVLEIAIFFGPFLLIAAFQGFRAQSREMTRLNVLSIGALLVFILMILAGTYRTGETARICLYLYPYLIFPMAVLPPGSGLSGKTGILLLSLVFFQSMLMQMTGNYFW